MRLHKSQTFSCYVIIFPAMALLLTFVYLPIVWAFSKSFYRFEIGTEPESIGFKNYSEYLFHDPTFIPSLLHMFALTAFAVITRLTIPLVVAKLIHSIQTESARHFYRILFLVPIVVPGVATQLIWESLVLGDQGLVNSALDLVGLGSLAQGWLSSGNTALVAIMLVGFPFCSGFDILIYYAGLTNIPKEVNEACSLDGCNGFRKFIYMDIPQVMSQLKLILVLTVIQGLQGFENIFILTNGGPGFKTMVPGLWMYLNAFNFQRMGYACAIGVLLFFLILTLTVVNFRYFRSSEDLKGESQ